ncbi:hypothetical protein LXL04_037768 [Taraxacum kok-saghyz]
MFDVLKNNRVSICPSLPFLTFLLVSVSCSLWRLQGSNSAAGVALATGPLVAFHLQHTSSPPVASLHLQVFQNFLFNVRCFKEQSRLHLSISPVSDFSPGLGLLLSMATPRLQLRCRRRTGHWSTGRTSSPTHFVSAGRITSSSANIGGYCLMGKIPLDFLHLSWEKSPNLSLGERVEVMSTVSIQSCFMKLTGTSAKEKLSFQLPHNSEAVQVPVMISAEELGAKDISPYDVYSYNNIPRNSMPHVIRYLNLLHFGLKLHLVSSHDMFRFEFWVGDSEPMEIDIYSPNAKDVTGPESPQTLPGTKLLQFAKTRKLSVERSKS